MKFFTKPFLYFFLVVFVFFLIALFPFELKSFCTFQLEGCPVAHTFAPAHGFLVYGFYGDVQGVFFMGLVGELLLSLGIAFVLTRLSLSRLFSGHHFLFYCILVFVYILCFGYFLHLDKRIFTPSSYTMTSCVCPNSQIIPLCLYFSENDDIRDYIKEDESRGSCSTKGCSLAIEYKYCD